jgi:hypothetical protein
MSIKQFPGGVITKSPTAPTTAAAKGIWTLGQAADFVKQGIWPRSPGVPTIGTATAVGATGATVAYTAPSDLGTGSVTFTATSTPGSITGTGASPITVSGLTINTSYTFKVTATTPGGTGPASAASNSVTPTATVPGAPTIGTATATSSTTATVVYTAPASDGGSTITSYTATSSPSGITGTLSQAGSGTITVSGLTGGTAYTFTVTATNAIGTSAASAASNSITTVPVVGSSYGGGYFAGQISTAGNGVADYNLVIGPKASAQSGSTLQFKTSNTDDPGAVSRITGPANSASMDNAAHPAAQFCEGLTIGGFSDWYWPAVNEMEICYFNLKPSTSNNAVGQGDNSNSVPSRSLIYYTSGNPAQTSATIFRTGNAEAFNVDYYWSSTQSTATQGWIESFYNGQQIYSYQKTNSWKVRAARRVAV